MVAPWSVHALLASALLAPLDALMTMPGSSEHLERSESSRPPLLFVGVCSHANNVERRRAIRATYWQDPALVGGLMEAKFVLGSPKKGTAVEAGLAQEMLLQPQDFLHLPGVVDGDDRLDGWYNRTAKSVALFEWFRTYSLAKYLMKLEDNVFPHFDSIVVRLTQERDSLVQLGRLAKCEKVEVAGQWSGENKIWSHSHYPKLMQGGGYIISRTLLDQLAWTRSMSERRLLHREDATLGMWIENDKRALKDFDVHLKDVPMTVNGCSHGDLMSLNVSADDMLCYWQKRMNGEANICCGTDESLLQGSADNHPRTTGLLEGGSRVQSLEVLAADNTTDHDCFNSSIPDELLEADFD